MTSQWDLPEAREAEPAAVAGHRHVPRSAESGWSSVAPTSGERRRDGFIDPVAFVSFLLRNVFRIGFITIVLTVVAIMLFRMVPFAYRATATVLVDPRNQQVTLQEDVLQSIGSDAAILESMVQIMKSDGFLLTVLKQVNADDGFADLSQAGQLQALAEFKKNLTIERKGATYLVEISFKAPTAEEAARVANAVAASFADTQNGYLSQATQNAAKALSERLIELRGKLNASEKAVADFAAKHGILYVDGNSTLQMRQLTELSAQLAVAKTTTEEARARYQEQTQGSDASVVLSSERSGEPAQLSYLRQQRTQLMQTLSQQSLTYGARHPRIAQTRQLISEIEKQIIEEKQTLVKQLKGALDVAQARQDKLEAEIAQLTSGAVVTDSAKVQLEALRREAAADRDIYEKFLSRNKATDELAELKSENVQVVSPAIPPLQPMKPSIVLVAPILGFLSACAATAMVVAAHSTGLAGVKSMASRRRKKTVPADAEAAKSPAESVEPVAQAAIVAPSAAAAEPAPETAAQEEKPNWQKDWEQLAARLDAEREQRMRTRAEASASVAPREGKRIQPATSLLMMSEAKQEPARDDRRRLSLRRPLRPLI